MWRARYRDPAGKRACPPLRASRRCPAVAGRGHNLDHHRGLRRPRRWQDRLRRLVVRLVGTADLDVVDPCDSRVVSQVSHLRSCAAQDAAQSSRGGVDQGDDPAISLPRPGVGGIDDPHTLQLRPYGTRGRGEGPNDCREPRQRRDAAEAAPTSHRHDHPDARSAQRGSSTPPLTSSARTSTSAPSLDYGSARLPRSGPGTSTPRLTF